MQKIKQFLWVVLISVFLSLSLAGGVSASDGRTPSLDDEVVFFGTYTLESGERLEGSLIVFGGVVTLEEDSVVTGDVLIFGGNVTASGRVKGALVVIGGVASLAGSAVVEGDLIAPATVVRREEGARIFGQIITENIPQIDVPEIPQPEIPVFPDMPEVQAPTFLNQIQRSLQPVVKFFSVIAQALVFSAVAALVGLALPKHNQVVRKAIEEQPVLSGGFGLLSVGVFIAAVVMLSLLSITVILIPLTVPLIVLFSVALMLGLLFGLIAVGGDFGRRMMGAFKQEWTVTMQTAVGSFGLSFLLGLLTVGLLGFLGGLMWIFAGAVGLGAVLLTRFGTQVFVPAGRRSAVPVQVMEAVEIAPDGEEDPLAG